MTGSPRLAALRAALASAVVAALATAPRVAEACYVCMSGRDDETRWAFIWTTGFLTVLPLGLLGGGFWWLRRRLRQLEQQQGDALPAAADEPAASASR